MSNPKKPADSKGIQRPAKVNERNSNGGFAQDGWSRKGELARSTTVKNTMPAPPNPNKKGNK